MSPQSAPSHPPVPKTISLQGSAARRFQTQLLLLLAAEQAGWHKSGSHGAISRGRGVHRIPDDPVEAIVEGCKLTHPLRQALYDEDGDIRTGKLTTAVLRTAYHSLPPTCGPLPRLRRTAHACAEFSALLNLSRVEKDILCLSLHLHLEDRRLETLTNSFQGTTLESAARVLARLTGHEPQLIHDALTRSGKLGQLGLFKHEQGTHELNDWLELNKDLESWFSSPQPGTPPLGANRNQATPTCALHDFPHLAAQADLVLRLLREAQLRRTSGVNILLVGPPGSGKTVLTRALARHLHMPLYEVDYHSPAENRSLDAEERIQAYRRAQTALQRSCRALVLFDEAEDIVGQNLFTSTGLRKTKASANNLLEQNPVPTLWTTNSTDGMDPAWLRRFMIIVDVPIPPETIRRRIVESHFSRTEISAEMRRALARCSALSPGHLSLLTRTLELATPKNTAEADAICHTTLKSPLRILTGTSELPKPSRYADYRPEYLNLEGGDPQALLASVQRNGCGRILLSGPPGTGKTGFAHFVAQELGKPLLCKTASDLLGMYVGQTEENIARMFLEAQAEEAVLVLDEADSFFRDRRDAQRSWEVSQVNEILARMEDFSGTFFCSTNFSDHFDPAAMRRFMFKIRFGYLRPEQSLAFARQLLPHVEWTHPRFARACETLTNMPQLTPADFTNAKRRVEFLNESLTPSRLVEELRAEQRSKQESAHRAVGFSSLSIPRDCPNSPLSR